MTSTHVDRSVNGTKRLRRSGWRYRCVAKYQMPFSGYRKDDVTLDLTNARIGGDMAAVSVVNASGGDGGKGVRMGESGCLLHMKAGRRIWESSR